MTTETGGDEGRDDAHRGETPPGGEVDALAACVGTRCREVVGVALRAVLALAEDAASGGVLPLDDLRRIALAVMNTDGALLACYSNHASKCIAYFEMLECERKRKDFFGRVVTHPIGNLLEDPDSGIERKNLPQFFAAIRMIVGDEHNTAYRDLCTMVANELRGGSQEMPWEAFYADPRIVDVLEEVLVAIARSFRHFDPRREWFLILMNTDPESVSLATHAFVSKKSGEKLSHQFGDPHFARLFRALFASVRPETFDKERETAFLGKFGSSPNTIFGNLFVELANLEQSPHPSPSPPRAMGFEPRKPPGKSKRS
ncbi:MAG: hypothetical protein HQL33_12510 [Alphaproteobacteria bacterium]|nr:hypothetical protein [Alphaproteobacteria bacterium]